MPNHLAGSLSPYLLQHADNPVDWWPWGSEAFAEAKRRDVPILVSIGYSTCHWCHVMAHESFEDAATGAAMNAAYVAIKVDREEHPEVDEIYMDAIQALTGHGGWPLNAFVDHAGRPFYAVTYLPHDRWDSLCAELARLWTGDRPRIAQAAKDVTAHLAQEVPKPGTLDASLWTVLGTQCDRSWDAIDPGFAYNEERQPKFPASQLIPLLLDSGRPEWRQRGELALEAMQDAGLHDRVGGGFHRYSVTRDWRLPHFEKMLYDNAQLMGVYARAGRLLDRADFLRTAVNTGDYLLRDLRVTTAGTFAGYASAEDADDPGGEGSFYAWSPEALRTVLGATDGEALIRAWNLQPGRREAGPHGHLDPIASHIPHPRGAGLHGRDEAIQAARLSWEPFLPRLRAARDRRPRPGRDGKVLTDLNALALEGFAALGRFAPEADRPRFLAATRELADLLRSRRTPAGLQRLTGRPAFITDYGHLVSALTAAFDLLGDPVLIDEAAAVADEAITRLRGDDGGFHTTPAGRDDLIRRSRESADNAYPAGQNSLAVGLVRLWMVTGEDRWRATAEGIVASAAGFATRAPTAISTLLTAWRGLKRGPRTAVVTGPQGPLLAACRAWPGADLSVVPASIDRPWECLAGRIGLPEAQVLICIGNACLAPITRPEDLPARLAGLET